MEKKQEQLQNDYTEYLYCSVLEKGVILLLYFKKVYFIFLNSKWKMLI